MMVSELGGNAVVLFSNCLQMPVFGYMRVCLCSLFSQLMIYHLDLLWCPPSVAQRQH